MSKSKIGIMAWLAQAFSSHKSISEALPADQYANFVADSEKLQQLEIEHSEAQQHITDLETSLQTAQSDLESEKQVSAGLQTKLTEADNKATELQTKLTESEDQKTKLRQSVNKLGDEDITNSADQKDNLTKADIEARESYKANRSEA